MMGFNLLKALVGLIVTLILPSTTYAHVVGVTQRDTIQPSGSVRDAEGSTQLRITVWYPAPSDSETELLVIGPPRKPLFEVGSAAPGAPFLPSPDGAGRRPVILLSHGFGGTAYMMGWFAIAMASEGYIVLSVDHPGNNGIDEMTVAGGLLWWERAVDLKLALEEISRDDVLGQYIDLERVGAAGFSAGGFTSLLLGGARTDRGQLASFCEKNPDDGVCRPQIEFPITASDIQSALRNSQVADYVSKAQADYSVPSVKAVFTMAPALIQAISSESLRSMSRPVSIIVGDADSVAQPKTNALEASSIIPEAQIKLLPEIGHYAFLSTCTASGKEIVPVCAQVGNQSKAHTAATQSARRFFIRTLGQP